MHVIAKATSTIENSLNDELIPALNKFETWQDKPNMWTVGLDNFKLLADDQFEDNAQSISGSFSGMIYLYERINFDSSSLIEKEKFAKIIREIEPLFAQFEREGRLELSHLYLEGAPKLDMRILNKDTLAEIEHTRNIPKEVRDAILNNGEQRCCNFTGCTETQKECVVVPPIFRRLPSSFKGQEFIVGGERSNCENQLDSYILNYDIAHHPDIWACAENISSLVCIPDNKFEKITFNFIGIEIFSSNENSLEMINEYQRILQNDGLLHFKTVHGTKEYFKSNYSSLCMILKNLKGIFKEVKWERKKDSDWPNAKTCHYYSFIAKK